MQNVQVFDFIITHFTKIKNYLKIFSNFLNKHILQYLNYKNF